MFGSWFVLTYAFNSYGRDLHAIPCPETLQWTSPEMMGDLPPPCRAHSATVVGTSILIFGGGDGSTYYNHLYVLDTCVWFLSLLSTSTLTRSVVVVHSDSQVGKCDTVTRIPPSATSCPYRYFARPTHLYIWRGDWHSGFRGPMDAGRQSTQGNLGVDLFEEKPCAITSASFG